MPVWLKQLLPILLLLAVISAVVYRLPKIDLGHSDAFKRRRFLNWFPLGLTYAFLYMGRYNIPANLTQLGELHLIGKQEFGDIDFWGSVVYGFSFLLNGPLTDRWGGRATILISAGGSALMNVLMGVLLQRAQAGGLEHEQFIRVMTILYSVNMYFQSFGAVSIVKVNAPWFHVRERGLLGGVFGILISLGVYFAYDWTKFIADKLALQWAFHIPALILFGFLVLDYFVIRDSPKEAGHRDFDTADASSGESDERVPVLDVVKRMFSQRVIWIIVAIEFCSGFTRQAMMKWYRLYADKTGIGGQFVSKNFGLLLCIAGILGGMFAGLISDYVFGSRRGPVASVLYGGMTVGALVVLFTLGTPVTDWTIIFMSLCVIGVHGMLSGTASMDFGGKKNAGLATGIIDGFVYLGSGAQALIYGRILPEGDAAKDPGNWTRWPLAMLPVVIIGLILAMRVWNARPQRHAAAH